MLVFGPVPSRRLGRSLGINNIPPKSCSYACLYCQLGPTPHKLDAPRDFYAPPRIAEEVARQVAKSRAQGEPIDYLTFVPDGEPTLDRQLGVAIDLLRPLEIPIAVITNASLLWLAEVRDAVGKADWVSLKVDSVDEATWKRINRPHSTLQLAEVLRGVQVFGSEYTGDLVTETMLIHGVNDAPAQLDAVAAFIASLQPRSAYLAVPTRPTAERGIHGPDEAAMTQAFQTFERHLPQVEYLIGYEGDAFVALGDVTDELLSIAAVHPLRESAMRSMLERAGAGWNVVERLMAEGKLVETEYQGERFYLRRFLHPEEQSR